MRDQTLSFVELTRGMAACVREWLLPHVTDPMARAQAEELATLLEGLPVRYGPAASAAIAADTVAARAVLAALGESAPDAPAPTGAANPTAVDALMAENRVLVGRLEALAAAARATGDQPRLERLQRFFLDRVAREAASTGGQRDFAAMTAAEAASRRS
jgi:hypothetical protein